jgi:hypothetical protein
MSPVKTVLKWTNVMTCDKGVVSSAAAWFLAVGLCMKSNDNGVD